MTLLGCSYTTLLNESTPSVFSIIFVGLIKYRFLNSKDRIHGLVPARKIFSCIVGTTSSSKYII